MGKGLTITTHAAEQYQKRWCPEKDFGFALRELEGIASQARPIRQKTKGRRPTTIFESCGVRLVVQDGHVVVTVLEPEPVMNYGITSGDAFELGNVDGGG